MKRNYIHSLFKFKLLMGDALDKTTHKGFFLTGRTSFDMTPTE
jgi:hypothetical protein